MKAITFTPIMSLCIIALALSCTGNDPRPAITNAITGYSPTTYLDFSKGSQPRVGLQAADILHVEVDGDWAYAVFRQNNVVGDVVLNKDSQGDAVWSVLRIVYFSTAGGHAEPAAIGKTRALSHRSPPEAHMLKWKQRFLDVMKNAGVTEVSEKDYDRMQNLLSQV